MAQYSSDLRISVALLYAVSFIVALAGNASILHIICKKRQTRTTISFLFVNMAVADLIVTLIAMPESTAHYFINKEWPGGVGGDILCRIVRFSLALAISASIFTLAAMTFDRFVAVVYPFRARELRAPPKTCSAVVWVGSIILMSHRLLTYSTSNDLGDCEEDWGLFQVNNRTGLIIWCVVYFVFLFILPVVPMAVCFSIMCRKLQRRGIPGEATAEQAARRRRTQRNRKIVKMLITIVVVFILCWIPVQAMHFVWLLKLKVPPYVMFLCFWFGHSHSAINPWMYIYLNTQFRHVFWKTIGYGAPGSSARSVPRYKANRVSSVMARSVGPARDEGRYVVGVTQAFANGEEITTL